MQIILLTSEADDQDSVTKISHNLAQLYSKLFSNIKTVPIENVRLDKSAIRYIVIHPLVVTHPLFHQLLETSNPLSEFVFHLFGDYTRKSSFYLKLENALLGKKITWVTASTSFKKLVEKTLKQASVSLLPFPLDLNSFQVSEKLRLQTREQLGLQTTDKLFLYSGRLSPQKNIIQLIEEFHNWHAENTRFHLALIGHLDHFENPTFFEKKYRPGEYFFELSTLLKKLNNKNIHIIEHSTHSKLNAYYNAADLFMSFSLYHDEDYGYSPLEALASGCPCLLTRWCGFKDTLKAASQFGIAKKIVFENNELKFEKTDIHSLTNILQIDLADRRRLANTIHNTLDYSILGDRLLEILNEGTIFKGFTEEFSALAINLLTPSIPPNEKQYEHFYHSFWSEE